MPMIDVYAAAGTFRDTHALARTLAAALMADRAVPDIPMFRKNTAAFVHELPATALSNVDGDSNYVRVQVLTNAGALDRDKQLAVVDRLRPSSPKRPAIHRSRSAPGCCSPKRPTAAGASRPCPHQRRARRRRARRDLRASSAT